MIGETHVRAKTTVWETVLSYTTIAAPLSLEQISVDISEVYRLDKSPAKIEMWQHQWDWLTKDVDNTGSYLFGAPDMRVGYKSLYGIPVTVLK